MVKYVYEKYYAIIVESSYSLSWGPDYTFNVDPGTTVTGATSYTFDRQSGSIDLSGRRTVSSTSGGTVYDGGGGSITRYSLGGTKLTTRDGMLQYNPGSTSRGTRVGQIFAEDWAYPLDGIHTDGFWYVRRMLAEPPILLSPNGGEYWDTLHTIKWTNTQSGLKYIVELSRDNGKSWSILLSESAINANSLDYNFVNILDTGLAKIRVTGISGTALTESAVSAGVFTISHNVPPTIPTNLSPKGSLVDRTSVVKFSWNHNDPNPNDPQSRALIRWRLQGTTTWNEITSISTNQEYFFIQGLFPSGQIEWDVRTVDQQGLISPYSEIAVFTSATPTNAPTINNLPTIVPTPFPVIEWTSAQQVSYQIVVEDGLSRIVWDTGEVVSNVKARTVGVELINGAIYKIKLRTKDVGGIFSPYTVKSITISYTPPAKPIVKAFEAKGFIAISIDSPPPTESQLTVKSYEIYKRINNEWTRIVYGINASFNDYYVRSGETYDYYVKAIAENGTSSISDIFSQSAKFNGSFIFAMRDAEATMQHFKYNGNGYQTSFEPESSVMKFAGRTHPVIHFGNYEDYSLTVRIEAIKGMSDMDVLRGFVSNREAICYRDSDGNLLIGHILALNTDKAKRITGATITIVESDFNEGV